MTFTLRQFTLFVFLLNAVSIALIPFSPGISALHLLRILQGFSGGPDHPAAVHDGLARACALPDVLEAEARPHAATAQTGVAVASFYPDVSLTGSFNLNGLRLRDAFSLPSRAFDVGPSVSIPVFQGGRLTGQLRLRESQQREAASCRPGRRRTTR